MSIPKDDMQHMQTMRIHIADDDETIVIDDMSSQDELVFDTLSVVDDIQHDDVERIVV